MCSKGLERISLFLEDGEQGRAGQEMLPHFAVARKKEIVARRRAREGKAGRERKSEMN